MTETTFRVRKCTSDDMERLYSFVTELAEFEKAPEQVIQSPDDFRRDGFEVDPPLFHAAFIEIDDNGWEPVGFANWTYMYTTWKGRGFYLDDRKSDHNRIISYWT